MTRLMLRCFVLLVLLAAVLNWPGAEIARAEEELVVSAAASLTNGLKEVGEKFEASHPGMKVIFNFAASGALLRQLEQGAPVDVFASADQKSMDEAEEKGLISTGSRIDFVSNQLVLIVPIESKLSLKTLSDLARPEVERLSLGNVDSVPAGRYAKQVLVHEKLWEELTPKFVFANTVRQVLDYVSRGEVDAGFVYATDAVIGGGKVKVAVEAQGHEPILYPVAVTKMARNVEAAKLFVDFTTSAEAREIFGKHGFGEVPR